MSRGLSKQDAMHLVTYGYFLPVLEFISVESLKERIFRCFERKGGTIMLDVLKIRERFPMLKKNYAWKTSYLFR